MNRIDRIIQSENEISKRLFNSQLDTVDLIEYSSSPTPPSYSTTTALPTATPVLMGEVSRSKETSIIQSKSSTNFVLTYSQRTYKHTINAVW